ncbi:leucine-rich_repeat domain-containing protein [Hexamita inflata]|uniref:Leucine-rich repeat domain-containing protein n=1 Tax=Hexamita inflata TaxID=28002 RepID=A0AA86QI30_9EUKA|nr:leucine-rich repeat domain-containing protein [Hexamita inflata]
MPFIKSYKQSEQIKVLSQEEENEYDEQMIQKYIEYSKSKYSVGYFEDDLSITTIKFVEKLNLKELQVQLCYNLNFARVPMCVTNLDISRCNLQKLDGLRQMQQLTELRIFNNYTPIQLQELQYLTNLKYLDLYLCKVTDISPIKYLNDLQNLILSRNNIRDINPLMNLKNLVELQMIENKIIDLSPLQDLIQLKYIELSKNPIVHINALRNLTNLNKLTLSQTFVENLTPIKHHEKRNKYEIEDLKVPTNQLIEHSMNYMYIKYLEEMLRKYENTETQFKNRIQLFNKKITKPYKAALKNMRKFSEQILNLFKQLETDGSFDQ